MPICTRGSRWVLGPVAELTSLPCVSMTGNTRPNTPGSPVPLYDSNQRVAPSSRHVTVIPFHFRSLHFDSASSCSRKSFSIKPSVIQYKQTDIDDTGEHI